MEQKTRPEQIEIVELRTATLKLIEWPEKQEDKEKGIRAQKSKRTATLSYYDKKLNGYAQLSLSKRDLEILQQELPSIIEKMQNP